MVQADVAEPHALVWEPCVAALEGSDDLTWKIPVFAGVPHDPAEQLDYYVGELVVADLFSVVDDAHDYSLRPHGC